MKQTAITKKYKCSIFTNVQGYYKCTNSYEKQKYV